MHNPSTVELQLIASLSSDDMNALQSNGIISDLCVNPSDIAYADYPNVIKWLNGSQTPEPVPFTPRRGNPHLWKDKFSKLRKDIS